MYLTSKYIIVFQFSYIKMYIDICYPISSHKKAKPELIYFMAVH